MLLWNKACRFHYSFSLNWMFVNVKVSTMTCEMKQKHHFYINLILLFPTILSQSGSLDMLNLLQWFPWQPLFIVVTPRTPVIMKPNFAKGLAFAFFLLALPRQSPACFLLCAPPSPQAHWKAGVWNTQWDVIEVLWLVLQGSLFKSPYTLLFTAAFPVNPQQKGEVLGAVHPQKHKMLCWL